MCAQIAGDCELKGDNLEHTKIGTTIAKFIFTPGEHETEGTMLLVSVWLL